MGEGFCPGQDWTTVSLCIPCGSATSDLWVGCRNDESIKTSILYGTRDGGEIEYGLRMQGSFVQVLPVLTLSKALQDVDEGHPRRG